MTTQSERSKIRLSGKDHRSLLKHIEDLGLASVTEYRAWCRDHGYDDALKKHWRERRKELLTSKRQSDAEPDETALVRHLETMGMKTTGAYQTWCRQHGFSAKLYKSEHQRVRERKSLGQAKIQARRTGGLSHTRSTKLLEKLFEGTVKDDELVHPYQKKIRDLLVQSEDETAAIYRGLLKAVQNRANIFDDTPVVGHIGPEPGNTFVEGLFALARFHTKWLRQPEEWEPDSHNPHQQFGDLARHLLCEFSVPRFMNTVWFKGTDTDAVKQQSWFHALETGQNIRSLEVPIPLTKKMAHHFLDAPDDFSVEWSLRWGELMGLGAGEELVHAIVATRLEDWFVDPEFFRTVFHFFINNPMLDPAYVNPIVDYIHNQRYVRPEVVQPDGQVVLGSIPQPGFTMKGRTVDSMLT